MPGRKAYSDDLRQVVVAKVDAGASRREAGRLLGISAASAVRWVNRKAQTGSVSPNRRGHPRSPLRAHTDWLLDLVKKEPDLTLLQIVAQVDLELSVKTSTSALDRFYRRNGYSFKKKCFTPPNKSDRMSPLLAKSGVLPNQGSTSTN